MSNSQSAIPPGGMQARADGRPALQWLTHPDGRSGLFITRGQVRRERAYYNLNAGVACGVLAPRELRADSDAAKRQELAELIAEALLDPELLTGLLRGRAVTATYDAGIALQAVDLGFGGPSDAD